MSLPESETPDVGEYMLAKLLNTKFATEPSLLPGDREAVSYRISEIMVCAKNLYTAVLPRLLQEKPAGQSMEEEIAGLRMTLLHLRDLVTDFDNVFLDSMFHDRQVHPEQVYDAWQPQGENEEEWTAEDLGLTPEEMEE